MNEEHIRKRRRVDQSDDDDSGGYPDINAIHEEPAFRIPPRRENNTYLPEIDLRYLISDRASMQVLSTLTLQQSSKILDKIYKQCRDLVTSNQMMEKYIEFFQINDVVNTGLDVVVAKYMCGIMLLYHLFMKNKWAGMHSQATEKRYQQFKFILNTLKTGEKCMQVCKQQKLLLTNMDDGEPINLFDYSMPDQEKQTKWQQLILFCLQKLSEHNWRKYNGACYEEIVVYHVVDFDGNHFFAEKSIIDSGDFQHCTVHHTISSRAWKYVCDIEDVIQKLINRNQHYDQWLLLTHQQNNERATAGYLKHCVDHQFPELKPDRNIRTFNNGVMVFEFGNESFYPFRHLHTLDTNAVSCKYIPLEFDVRYWNMKHWYNIPTPVFQHVLESQSLSPQVCAIIYGMLGRLLYPLGSHDNWQVILFLQGVANSGKSTIGKVVKMFFDISQVAILSSNAEDKFGLEPLLNHLVWICFEVTKSWSISRCDFQSMVSGEDVSAARKNKVAQQITWDIPGLLLGNEMGPWLDSAGSIIRRLLVCKFQNTITEVDNDLDKKLFQELPMILYKCQSAYVSMVKEYKSDGIWQRIPRYFKKVQKDIAVNTNPIKAFLCESPFVVRNADAMMPFYVFSTQFKEYAKGNRTKMIFTADEYKSVFDQEGITMVEGKYEWNGRKWGGRWIKGVCLLDNAPDEESQENPINEEQEDDEEEFVQPPNELCSLVSHIWDAMGTDTQTYYDSVNLEADQSAPRDEVAVIRQPNPTSCLTGNDIDITNLPEEAVGFREDDVLE